MSTLGLLARIEARPEHAEKVAQLLRDALDLARQEEHTVTWFAFRQGETTFGVFDTFADEEGRQEHLRGRIAAALTENAATLLSEAPDIRPVDLLAVKLP